MLSVADKQNFSNNLITYFPREVPFKAQFSILREGKREKFDLKNYEQVTEMALKHFGIKAPSMDKLRLDDSLDHKEE